MKTCPTCKKEKSLTEFYAAYHHTDQLSHSCKLCVRERTRIRKERIKSDKKLNHDKTKNNSAH